MDKVNGAAFVKSLAAAHMQSNPPLEGDYTGEDGLLRCGKCGGFKRSRIEVSGEEIIVPVWCEYQTLPGEPGYFYTHFTKGAVMIQNNRYRKAKQAAVIADATRKRQRS